MNEYKRVLIEIRNIAEEYKIFKGFEQGAVDITDEIIKMIDEVME